MNIKQTMEHRTSVRTYSPTPLDESHIAALQTSIDTAGTPFGGDIKIGLVHFTNDAPARPGTYGVIKGAEWFMVMSAADDDRSWLSAGFMMEQPVLEATELGLGTCWMAATFSSKQFSKVFEAPEGQKIMMVSPVGYPVGRKRILERITGMIAKSRTRKEFSTLFRDTDTDSRFNDALEMMRLAPSSVNSQPWRAIVSQGAVHFYNAGKGRLSLVDMGIGLCHFYLTCRHNGIEGKFQQAEAPQFDKATYVCSFLTDQGQ